jgi:hypothetical protein
VYDHESRVIPKIRTRKGLTVSRVRYGEALLVRIFGIFGKRLSAAKLPKARGFKGISGP